MHGTYRGRFAPLYEATNNDAKRRKKRTHSDTSAARSPHPQNDPGTFDMSTSRNEFEKLDMNGKMNCLFDLMSHSVPLLAKMDTINESLYKNKAIYDVTEARLRLLEYKSLDMETRMLKTNLVFNGIFEPHYTNDTDSEAISSLKTFLIEKLKLSPENLGIVSAFRAGRRRTIRGRLVPRMIIASFSNVRYVSAVMDNVRELTGTTYGVSRDYHREIREARKELWQTYKDARTEFGAGNVKLIFPAELTVHGETVRNLFPGWKEILQGSRNSNVKTRTEIRLQAIVKPTLQAANQYQNTAPGDTAAEPETSDQGSDTESEPDSVPDDIADKSQTQNEVDRQQGTIEPTMNEPGYLLNRHPMMTPTPTPTDRIMSVMSVTLPGNSPPDAETPQASRDVNESAPASNGGPVNEPV